MSNDVKTEIRDCGHMEKYNEEYDAYYCEECNKWHEEQCDDPDCCFCRGRPDKPIRG